MNNAPGKTAASIQSTLLIRLCLLTAWDFYAVPKHKETILQLILNNLNFFPKLSVFWFPVGSDTA